MSSQYGELWPTSGWDMLASLWHPSTFQWVWCLGSVTAQHSSSGHQLNFAALNRGNHLYLAGRPSRWALAHILVVSNMFCVCVCLCVCVCVWCRLLQLTSAFTGRSIHWGRNLWSPLTSSIRCLFSHRVKRLLNSHILMALNASTVLLLTHFVWQHQTGWAAAVQCPVCCRWHTWHTLTSCWKHTLTSCWKHTLTSCWSSPSLFASRLISSVNYRFDRRVPDTLTPDSQFCRVLMLSLLPRVCWTVVEGVCNPAWLQFNNRDKPFCQASINSYTLILPSYSDSSNLTNFSS